MRRPEYLISRLGWQLGSLAVLPFGIPHSSESADFRNGGQGAELGNLYRRWVEQYHKDLVGVIESPLSSLGTGARILYIPLGLLLLLDLIRALYHLTIERKGLTSPVSKVLIVTCLLCLATNFLIAVVSTLDTTRYTEMQAPLFSFIGLLAGIIVLGRAQEANIKPKYQGRRRAAPQDILRA